MKFHFKFVVKKVQVYVWNSGKISQLRSNGSFFFDNGNLFFMNKLDYECF